MTALGSIPECRIQLLFSRISTWPRFICLVRIVCVYSARLQHPTATLELAVSIPVKMCMCPSPVEWDVALGCSIDDPFWSLIVQARVLEG